MEKQELLEKLAQLQKSLEDIESARKMVDETVNEKALDTLKGWLLPKGDEL